VFFFPLLGDVFRSYFWTAELGTAAPSLSRRILLFKSLMSRLDMVELLGSAGMWVQAVEIGCLCFLDSWRVVNGDRPVQLTASNVSGFLNIVAVLPRTRGLTSSVFLLLSLTHPENCRRGSSPHVKFPRIRQLQAAVLRTVGEVPLRMVRRVLASCSRAGTASSLSSSFPENRRRCVSIGV